MPPRHSSQNQLPAASPRRRSRSDSASLDTAPAASDDSAEADIAAELSFREAQTALELSLAELQAPDLDVEEMAGLYRRASRYADRCEQLLQQVEQEVMQWDAGQPSEPPVPYQP